ncbi:MAG TPA: peptidylprolyl isomerase [Thermotogota bacterium]|nr:peptidylprolyl isomerase [Thermotogota bacterium]HPJ88770.1 peptidylprolyl isomerase [Thermotogota bacterium]HPR96273.1 peptidylprolyl isomerase [Thermotogota bacterium]
MTIKQLEKPVKGEELCVIHTTAGDIKVRLFGDLVPKTVENFKTHARENYYNDTIFHRTIQDFMIQGGDPTGTGRGGESIYGDSFDDEFSPELVHFKGALSMANAGPNTNGSQFFIVQNSKMTEEYVNHFPLTDEQKKKYVELGGTPHLDNKHAVFGQVVEGLDIVDKIAGMEVDYTDRPTHPVSIESIDFETVE